MPFGVSPAFSTPGIVLILLTAMLAGIVLRGCGFLALRNPHADSAQAGRTFAIASYHTNALSVFALALFLWWWTSAALLATMKSVHASPSFFEAFVAPCSHRFRSR